MNVDPDRRVIITVAVPSHDMVHALWAYDLSQMLMYTTAVLGEKVGIRLLLHMNTYVPQARQELIEEALEKGTHYVLFVDADMRFPKDALIQLLAHDKDVVGVNYSTRNGNPQFVGSRSREVPEELAGDVRRNRLPTLPESTGLEKADFLGCGLMLMKADIFSRIERPFFDWSITAEGEVTGEDAYFCRKLNDAGIEVLCDHDLSKQMGHIGSFTYPTALAADTWLIAEEAARESHGIINV